MATKFTTKQLQSINYTLSDEDIKTITACTIVFEKYGIEFIDRVSSIRTIMRKAKQFRDRYPTSVMIIVIDNLGLISTDSFYKGNEKDDFLAGKIKELSDQTESSILLLHHITKENAKAFNLKDGYRPRKEYIKGSTRILDYVQQAMMVNLPRKYKDLMLQERDKAVLFNMKERSGKFDFTRFIMEFWSINPKGDKDTKGMADLRQSSWDELKFCCSMEKMSDGTDMRAGFVLNKYLEYSVYIDDINKPREERYKKPKAAIFTYIKNKMYNEDYKPEANSRTQYLYGDNLRLSMQLENIFIAEIIKNRDGADNEDTNVIRYNANLDYNIFKPLI